MEYHILNGDGLAGNFSLEGKKIIFRECLIEGNLKSENLTDFWQTRAEFIEKSCGDNSYFEKVKNEIEKLNEIKPVDQVNLWFGNEAFCQVNMWFILSLLNNKNAEVFRVFPDSDDWHCIFHELKECYESRQIFTNSDLQLGKSLWEAFSSKDFEQLGKLSKTKSACFIKLEEVCQALIEKETKTEKILCEILEKGETDFGKLFTQFQKKAGIYGFGDVQFNALLNKI